MATSEENNKKYDEARENALKKLQEARAAVQEANENNDACANALAEAQAQLDEMNEGIEEAERICDARDEAKEAQEEAERADKEYKDALKAANAASKNLNAIKNSSFYWSKRSDQKAAQAAFDQAHAKMVAAGNAKRAADKALAESNAPSENAYNEAKEKVDARDDAAKRVEDLAKECEQYEKEKEAAEKALEDLGYDENDLDSIKDLVRRAKKKYTGVSTAWARVLGKTEIEDLRNINGTNFRSVAQNNGVVNQRSLNVMNGGDARVSPSRSFYMNEDYLFTDSLASPTLDSASFASKPELQTLILSEFQPDDMLSVADLLPKSADKLAAVGEAVGKIGGNVAVAIARNSIVNGFIEEYSKDPNKLYNMQFSGASSGTRKRHYFTPDPVQQIQNMFNGGRWLNTFEIPYWGNAYLKGQYSGDWQFGAIQAAVGKGLGEMIENFGVDYPANPKFKTKMSSTRDPLKSEFYLINSSSAWLRKNFEFIQAIFAGTSWIHMKYCIIRPPNVFHVLCPGRFQIYWAALDSQITFEGKLRKNKEVSEALNKLGVKSIDEDMLWPDAWKIQLSIKDMTPNNFNNYAEYYARGYNEDEVAMLAQRIEVDEMIGDIKKYFSEFAKDAAVSIDRAAQTGAKVLNSVGSLVGDGVNALQAKIDQMAEENNNNQ